MDSLREPYLAAAPIASLLPGEFVINRGMFDPRPLGVRVRWKVTGHRSAFFQWHLLEGLQVVQVSCNGGGVYEAEYFSWIEVLKIHVWLEQHGYTFVETRSPGAL